MIFFLHFHTSLSYFPTAISSSSHLERSQSRGHVLQYITPQRILKNTNNRHNYIIQNIYHFATSFYLLLKIPGVHSIANGGRKLTSRQRHIRSILPMHPNLLYRPLPHPNQHTDNRLRLLHLLSKWLRTHLRPSLSNHLD